MMTEAPQPSDTPHAPRITALPWFSGLALPLMLNALVIAFLSEMPWGLRSQLLELPVCLSASGLLALVLIGATAWQQRTFKDAQARMARTSIGVAMAMGMIAMMPLTTVTIDQWMARGGGIIAVLIVELGTFALCGALAMRLWAPLNHTMHARAARLAQVQARLPVRPRRLVRDVILPATLASIILLSALYGFKVFVVEPVIDKFSQTGCSGYGALQLPDTAERMASLSAASTRRAAHASA